MTRKGSGRQGCLIDGCDRKHSSKGYCNLHYQRLINHGDPLGGGPIRTTERGEPLAWILRTLEVDTDECVYWPFADDGHGYGHFNLNGRPVKAHRFVCTQVNGSPPFSNSEAAHSCGQGKRGCVNWKHLRWASPKENNWDRVDHETHNRGERCGTHRLVRSEVLEIVSLIEAGRTHQSVADQYGVHRCTITDIAKGKNWSWLTGRVHPENPKPPAAANDNEPQRSAV